MERQIPKEQLAALGILVRLQQIAGIITFKISGESFRISKVMVILNCLRILTYLPGTVFNFYSRLQFTETSILIKTTDVIQLLVTAIYTLTTWVSALVKDTKHIELLEKIYEFDAELRQLEETIDYKKHTKHALMVAVLRIVTVLLSILGQIASYTYDTRISAVIFYFCLYSTFMINSIFCHMVTIYIAMIRRRFQLLNKVLIKLLPESAIATVTPSRLVAGLDGLQILCRICYLHHYMSKTIKLFNRIFGVCLLCMFVVSFANTVICLFYCTTAFQSTDTNWKVIINNGLLSICYNVDVVYVCHLAQYAIDEAKKAGVLIHKIETSDYDMKDEIEMFSLQIANERVEFNAAGFFPINYTLVFSIIGGVTTYIIILIQLAANKSINP